MNLTKKCIAEAVGTFWLVLGGCGSAVLAATFIGAEIGPDIAFPLGLGFLGVSLAFGLTVLTMAYAIGHISGCHLNPAVSFGLWAGGRFPSSDLLPYIISQVVGAIVGTAVIYLVATGQSGFDMSGATWAANGFGELSPGNFGLFASFLTEVVMTFMFLVVIFRRYRRTSSSRLCPNCDWNGSYAHPFDQHSGDEYLGKPRAESWPSLVCRA